MPFFLELISKRSINYQVEFGNTWRPGSHNWWMLSLYTNASTPTTLADLSRGGQLFRTARKKGRGSTEKEKTCLRSKVYPHGEFHWGMISQFPIFRFGKPTMGRAIRFYNLVTISYQFRIPLKVIFLNTKYKKLSDVLLFIRTLFIIPW